MDRTVNAAGHLLRCDASAATSGLRNDDENHASGDLGWLRRREYQSVGKSRRRLDGPALHRAVHHGGNKRSNGVFRFANRRLRRAAVVGEDFETRSMERNQSGLAELGVTDRENAFRPVDICGRRLSASLMRRPSHRQKSEQAVVGPRLQAVRGWHVFSGFEQLVNLLIGIEVGFGTAGAIRQQTLRRTSVVGSVALQ